VYSKTEFRDDITTSKDDGTEVKEYNTDYITNDIKSTNNPVDP